MKKDSKTSSTPKDIKTRTQLTPDDITVKKSQRNRDEISDEELEEEVALINPDVNSMESRG